MCTFWRWVRQSLQSVSHCESRMANLTSSTDINLYTRQKSACNTQTKLIWFLTFLNEFKMHRTQSKKEIAAYCVGHVFKAPSGFSSRS